MRYSGIGGQAVLEGVMMRNNGKYAIAVRKPDSQIEVKVSNFDSISNRYKILKLPLLRGVVNFVESLYIGMKALSFSAEFFEEEDEKKKKNVKEKNGILAALTVLFSIMLAIGVFMVLPYGLSLLFSKIITSNMALTVLEGVIRLFVLISYMVGISFLPDIKRVYQYHGAEHKAINCIESGKDLTVANVRKMTRKHLRCGTSFIIDVIILSIILFMFIRVENAILRLVFRLLLVPVIAAIAYEFLRIAGNSESPIVKILSVPGLWFQSLTTKEPDDKMIEVAIQSVEAVFDWRAFLGHKEERGKSKKKVKTEKIQEKEKKEEIISEIESIPKLHVASMDYKNKLKNDRERIRREGEQARETFVLHNPEEEEDDILNALDRFFNQRKEEEKKQVKGKKEAGKSAKEKIQAKGKIDG